MEDIINQPKHYTHGGIEVRPFINSQGYNFDMGNVIKYIVRAGIKTPDKLIDLEKALNYINDEIKKGNKKLHFEPTSIFISGYEFIRSQPHLTNNLKNVISLLSKDEKTDCILMAEVISARDLLQEEINMLKI